MFSKNHILNSLDFQFQFLALISSNHLLFRCGVHIPPAGGLAF